MASSSGSTHNRTFAIVLGSAAAATLVGGIIYYYSRKSKTQRSSSQKPVKSAKSKAAEVNAPPPGPLEKAVALKNKGNECFKASQYDDAIKYYSEAIESCIASASPAELSAFFQNRAAAQEKLHNFAAVVEDCTKALEGNKRYIKAIIRRGKAYSSMEKYKEALRDFTAACIVEQFNNFETMASAEQALKALGTQRAKIAMAERAGRRIPLSKTFVDSYLISFAEDPILNEIETSKNSNGGGGDHKETNITVNGELAGGDSLSGFEKVKYCLMTKQFEHVIDACTEEIERNGEKLVDATLVRATFWLIMGSWEQAMSDFECLFKALTDLPPDDSRGKKLKSNAYIKRASLFMQHGKKEESFADFQAAENADPDNADVYHHRGQILALLTDFDEAMRDFEKAVALRPDFPLCLAQRCYTKYRQAMAAQNPSTMHQAMEEFKNIVDKHWDCAEAYALYGQALAEHDDYDEARRLFDKASELSPSNANIYVHRAMIEAQSNHGDINKSVKLIERALKIDPHCEFAYEALGTTELQRGNMDRALELYEKAINCSRTELEMTHLFSLYEAASAQKHVAKELNVPLSNLMAALG